MYLGVAIPPASIASSKSAGSNKETLPAAIHLKSQNCKLLAETTKLDVQKSVHSCNNSKIVTSLHPVPKVSNSSQNQQQRQQYVHHMGLLASKWKSKQSSKAQMSKSHSAHDCLRDISNDSFSINSTVDQESTPAANGDYPTKVHGLPPSGFKQSSVLNIDNYNQPSKFFQKFDGGSSTVKTKTLPHLNADSVRCRPVYRSIAYKTWSVNGAREYPRFFRSQTDLTAADFFETCNNYKTGQLVASSTADLSVKDSEDNGSSNNRANDYHTLPNSSATAKNSSNDSAPKYVSAAKFIFQRDSFKQSRTKPYPLMDRFFNGRSQSVSSAHDDQTDYYSSEDYCQFLRDRRKNHNDKNNAMNKKSSFKKDLEQFYPSRLMKQQQENNSPMNSMWNNSLKRLSKIRSQSPFSLSHSPNCLLKKLRGVISSNLNIRNSSNSSMVGDKIHESLRSNAKDQYSIPDHHELYDDNNNFRDRSSHEDLSPSVNNEKQDREINNNLPPCNGRQVGLPVDDDIYVSQPNINYGQKFEQATVIFGSTKMQAPKFSSKEDAIKYVKDQLINIRKRDQEILLQLQNIESKIRSKKL